MGTYLLHCNEQRAKQIWNTWYQQTKQSTANQAIVMVEVQRAKLREYTLLSVTYKTAQNVRLIALISLIACLIVCEILTLFTLPFIKGIGAINSFHATPSIILIAAFFTLLCVTLFSPAFILGRLDWRCLIYEARLRDFILRCAVDASHLIPPRHWTLFPGDTTVIQIGTMVLVFGQLLTLSNLWGIIPFVSPLLLLLVLIATIRLIHAYAFDVLRKVFQPHIYWKLIVAALAQRTISVFVVPIFIYLFSSRLGHIGFAAAYAPQGPVLSTLLSFDEAITLPHYSDNLQHTDYIVTFFTFLYHYQYQSIGSLTLQIVLYAEFFLLAGIFISNLVGTRKFSPIFRTTAWKFLDINPAEISKAIPEVAIQKKSATQINRAILLEWVLLSIINVGGLGVVVLGLLSLFHVAPAWVPVQLLMPYIWYEISFQITLGITAGNIVAILVLFILFAPTLLWVLLWLYSLLRACWQSLTYIFVHNKHEAQAIVDELCKTIHSVSPIVQVENGTLSWPTTIPLLPTTRFCVIHISTALIEKLPSAQLRLVLAHELAHATKHAKKLWYAQFLSRLGIGGPGYLTLLVDYWGMELEADEFAVEITRDRQGLVTLLEQLETIEANTEAEALLELLQQQTGMEQQTQGLLGWIMNIGIVQSIVKAYKIYFGHATWGALHPPNKVRAETLRYRFDLDAVNEITIQGFQQGDKRDIQFTKQSRRVLRFAQVVAIYYKHNHLGTEHLLLALLDPKKSDIAHILLKLGEDPFLLARTLMTIFDTVAEAGGLAINEEGLTTQTKKVLELASNEAHRLNKYAISPIHLLIGLVALDDGIAAGVLEAQGITLEKLGVPLPQEPNQADTTIQPTSYTTTEGQASDSVTRQAVLHDTQGKAPLPYISPKLTQEERNMFDRLTDQAKVVIGFAYRQAQYYQHSYLETEHLLLGLVGVSDGEAARILYTFHVELQTVQYFLEEMITYGDYTGKIQISPQVKKVLDRAAKEADQLNHRYIRPEHLLLGLTQKDEGIAAGVLKVMQVDLEQVRETTLAALQQKETAPDENTQTR